ncbi:hypothetical protein JGS22_003515 [Streptomyces sp. P38-E01]|uniref:Uncharacterized protein n=1 Tax=Streptomyces tardus TaxID=2780544 RepID=A0A949JDV6_9ACTN|nr:hypothetical protein [Streptomyces tardus]MBU7596730.1 hypothetical protein [Streptomyces tardus]
MREISARMLAEERLECFRDALDRPDGFQVREGTNWLVRRDGATVSCFRISSGKARIVAEERSWRSSQLDVQGYASPAAGGLLFSAAGSVTYINSDGSIRWQFDHAPWEDSAIAKGACALTPSGSHVLATLRGPDDEEGRYAGDVCAVLDSESGDLVGQEIIPVYSGVYSFNHSLEHSNHVFLNAAHGQNDTYSLIINALSGDLNITQAGQVGDPLTGNCLDGSHFLKIDVGGDWLTLCEHRRDGSCPEKAEARTSDLNEYPDHQFVGKPGFVDLNTVLAAVAEETWSAESEHLLLDAQTLIPWARVSYPSEVSARPLPLGDGSWLTIENNSVRRWAG